MTKAIKQAPFRADIVGSFLRPAGLKAARRQFEEGKIDRRELTSVEDKYIRELVEKQHAAGLKVATDGEFRRSWWHLDFFWSLTGIDKVAMEQGYLFHGEETRAESARLTGRVAFNSAHPFLSHFAFLKSVCSDDMTPRQTIPAPAQCLAELERPENSSAIGLVYGEDRDALIKDLAAAYRQTILAFYELGCRNVQLDDCTWGMLCDRSFRAKVAEAGGDADAIAESYLRINNLAIADLPSDLVLTTHVCRGNYHSTWASSGGYEPVADVLFGREHVSAYYLEFDTDRAGGFEPLASVAADKQVVLGLVTSKDPKLERKEDLVRRIHEAARYIPVERLCLSPQCGFASTEEGNVLTEDEQWRKIALVQEVAAAVWKG